MKRTASLVRVSLAPQSVRDQGLGRRRLAQAAVANTRVHDELRLVEVGHPRRVRVASAGLLEMAMRFPDHAVRRVPDLGTLQGLGEVRAGLVVLASVEMGPARKASQLGGDPVQAVLDGRWSVLLQKSHDIPELADVALKVRPKVAQRSPPEGGSAHPSPLTDRHDAGGPRRSERGRGMSFAYTTSTVSE